MLFVFVCVCQAMETSKRRQATTTINDRETKKTNENKRVTARKTSWLKDDGRGVAVTILGIGTLRTRATE